MAFACRVMVRLRALRLERLEEGLLLGIILLGSVYPVLREAFPSAAHILCGLPTPDGSALTRQALTGKLYCVAALAVLLPWLAHRYAGSWVALTRVSALRIALVIAAVATAALTAYDACTGFHAADRTTQGCECWLTALLAGLAALVAALSVLAGRAIVRLLRHTVRAIVAALFERRYYGASPFLHRSRTRSPHAQHGYFAYRYSGRAPPLMSHLFSDLMESGAG